MHGWVICSKYLASRVELQRLQQNVKYILLYFLCLFVSYRPTASPNGTQSSPCAMGWAAQENFSLAFGMKKCFPIL